MSDASSLVGEFGTDFQAFDLVGDFSPVGWERVLNDPAVSDLWLREPRTLFTYDVDDRRYWLFLDKSEGWTFALRFEVHERLASIEMLVSVVDAQAMNEFVLLDDLCWYPTGSFVDRSAANAAILDFLTNPMRPPPSASWTDMDDLNWPEGA
jgi:hypothetical protein